MTLGQKSFCSAVPALFLSLIFLIGSALLSGCGDSQPAVHMLSSPNSTKSLIVPDAGNNRVLIYEPPFMNGGSGSVVLGQPGFNTATAATTPAGLTGPSGFALDSAGNLYVTDADSCRIVVFKPPFTNGMSATGVFGQATLTSATCTPTSPPAGAPTNLNVPNAVAFDAKGNLWVADSGYSRVLEYAAPFSDGMAATLALGEPSLTAGGTCSGNPTPTNSTLCSPEALAFDAAGNLWVSDTNSERVLEYVPPFSTGMAASLELGQPAATAFTSGTPNNGGISKSSLAGPGGLAFDDTGNLWVADNNNNRILEFEAPFSDGMAASAVMGQLDFSHGSGNQGLGAPTAATLSAPQGLEFDGNGRLVVGDTGNNRTLILNNFGDAQDTPVVLGQPGFTTGSGNQGAAQPSATTQNQPFAAGPSLLALAVFAALVAIWFVFLLQRNRKADTPAA